MDHVAKKLIFIVPLRYPSLPILHQHFAVKLYNEINET